MKRRLVLLLLVLSPFLYLLQSAAHAEAWPASREELVAADLPDETEYWHNGEYQDPTEKWARLWAQENYGPGAVILSLQYVDAPFYGVNVGKLLDGYRWLNSKTWEIRLIPQALSDDLKLSDGVHTVSIQVVYMEKEETVGIFGSRQFTLVGFLPPEKTFRNLFEVRAYLHEDPRFADSLAELRTIVPEGVTEIDLRTVLDGDAYSYAGFWMLNADVCAILRCPPDAGGYEIILLDIRDCSLLSRTPIPHADYLSREGWDNSAFYLLFELEGSNWRDPTRSHIKASISPDGTVDISVSLGRLTVMPGGKTAIREADTYETDAGSFYAVDLATGKEELLIQGVAGLGGGLSYEAYLEYVPCWDDYGYTEGDPWGEGSWDNDPFLIPFPLDEDDFHGYDIWFFRDFYVYKPLDEHRFVYTVGGWEWGAGYGVYDLQTRTDHRITGRGYFYGVAGDTLFGATLKADANTYATSRLSKSVQEQFESVTAMEDGHIDHDISTDGRLLALMGMTSRRSDAKTVTITDIRTGNVIKAYNIHNPFAAEHSVAFYDDTHFVLFCQPETLGSAYIYLFNVEE